MSTSDARMPDERIVDVGGVPINSVIMGSGPPVVLIHGASGNLRDWTFRAAPRLARDYTVIAFDRPGHGRSGLPETGGETLGVQAQLLRGAMTKLDIPRAIVSGHSYGGSVALALALQAPERVAGLLLISAPSHVWDGGLGLSTSLLANGITGPVLARIAPAVLSESFLRSAADGVFAPQSAPAGYVAHLDLDLVLQPATLRINARQLDALKEELRVMVPRYPALPMPIKILHGTADTTVPIEIHSEPFAREVSNARLLRLEGIGHMPHHVALDAVVAAVDRLAARM